MNGKRLRAQPARRPAVRALPPMEWTGDLLPGEIRLTALGSRCVLVENYSALCCCTGSCVQLSSRRGEVRVTGRQLSLADVRPGELKVCGFIERIEFPGGAHA